MLDDIEDKVVQEGAENHVSIPTIAAAHLLRVALANRCERVEFDQLVQLEKPRLAARIEDKTHEFIEDLRGAV